MFIRLVGNELMKINSKRQSLYFNLFLIFLTVAVGGVIAAFSTSMAASLNAVSFTSLMIQILPMIISLFGIVMGAQIVTEEFKDGTIKQLLIRPASRAAVLLSKYVTVVMMFILSYIVMIVAGLAVGAILFHNADSSQTLMDVLQAACNVLPYGLLLLTITFTAAVFIPSLGLAIGIGFFANIMSGMLVLLVQRYEWIKFIPLLYTNLGSYSSGNSPITMTFALTILGVYFIVLVSLSVVRFKTREIN